MMFCQLIMQPLLNRFHYYTLKELETKETTKTALSDWFLDICLTFDTNGLLSTRLNYKRNDFNFSIINVVHLDSNMQTVLVCGVFISQLILFARACSLFSDFIYCHRILSTKHLKSMISKRIVSSCLSKSFYQKMSTPCCKVFCELHPDDERWYWQLDFGSRLTIVSLFCLTIALYTN